MRRYLRTHRICYPPDYRQLAERGFSPRKIRSLVGCSQIWTYSPQKRQAGSAFALMYRLLLRSCTLMGVFVIPPVPSFLLESLPSSRAPSLHGHYAASQLLFAPPPPSRLPPFSWFGQLYGFLAPPSFLAGRGGLLQLLDMSLSPCCPYHPAEVSCRIGQPASCHAAFAPNQGARPPDL